MVQRDKCCVNHDGRNYPDACHKDAEFLISHERWGVTLQCCQFVAAKNREKPGYTVIAWDSVDACIRAGRPVPQMAAEYMKKWELEVLG
jgi:hypothetical protein